MLRRFKDQLSQVADELPGINKSRVNGNSRDSEKSQFADLADENGEIEGFLCPMCMTHFPSPEQLSQHFETAHAEKNAFVNPNYDAPSVSRDRSEKENNIEELRIQLREEKLYGQKIKEELDRIQSVVAQATDVPEGEVPYLLQQIQVLEAGKSMVTQRMLEFEKESGQLRRAVDNGAKERADIMAKLKQQSQQLRDMAEEGESHKVEKEMINRELIQSKIDNTLLNSEIDKLSQTLDQRPSEDDVAVLRTELINAQKLMDEIAQQKDVEIQEHLHAIRHLNLEREKDNCIRQNLQTQLESSGVSTSEKDTRLTQLETELLDKKSQLETIKKEAETTKAQASQLQDKNADLQARLELNMNELSAYKEKAAQLENTIRSTSHEIEDASGLNSKNQEKLQSLSQKLEQMVDEKRKQEMEILAFEERHQKQEDLLKSMESNNAELTKQLSSTGTLLEQEKASLAQKVFENEELEKKSKDLENKVDDMNSKCERQTKDLEEGAGIISSLREKIASLEVNAKDLMAKISEGEGGAKMAIDQLTEDNRKLTVTITELNAVLQEQKQQRDADIENLNVKLRAAEKTASDSLARAKKDNEELKKKLDEALNDLKKSSDRFEEMEKETEAERRKTSERFEKLKEMVQQRDTIASGLREQLEQAASDSSEKDRQIREKERHLEESKRKIEESVRKLEEAEAKARALEAALKESESLRETATLSEEELREELSKAQQSIQTLKTEGSQLRATATEKENEIDAVKRDWEQKAQHWDVKKREYEEQLVKNQEANEELLHSLSEAQTSLATLKKESETNKNEITELKEARESMSKDIEKLEADAAKYEQTEREVKNSLKQKAEEMETIAKEHKELQEWNDTILERVKAAETEAEQLKMEKAEMEEHKVTLQHVSEAAHQEVEKNLQEIEEYKEKIQRYKKESEKLRGLVSGKEEELAVAAEKQRVAEESFATERANQDRKLDELAKEKVEIADQLRRSEQRIDTLTLEVSETVKRKERAEEELKTAKAEIDAKSKTAVTLQEAIHMLNEKVESQEEIFVLRQNELQDELSTLKRSVQSLQSEVDEKSRELAEARITAEELAAKNIEYQQQTSSWNDEKNALIERCLRTESDLEFERDRALENKRRFDDSVAAMHELGRANQSLQMDISKHTTRKWLDDSAAVNCTACGKVFTMTIRKHHCRVCGLIFCGPCSDKTVKIVSNKNPVRVCASCHTEVLNR